MRSSVRQLAVASAGRNTSALTRSAVASQGQSCVASHIEHSCRVPQLVGKAGPPGHGAPSLVVANSRVSHIGAEVFDERSTTETRRPSRRRGLETCVDRCPNGTGFSRRSLLPATNSPLLAAAAARYDHVMSGVPADLPSGAAVVLTNPDEDASPKALSAFIDELLGGPEPELESVDAAEAVRALRVDAQVPEHFYA